MAVGSEEREMPNPKKIAIIGGGISGILSITALKEEGHLPICFEKTDKYGGTFCYREESIEGVGSVMPTTVILNNKESGAISNFPPSNKLSVCLRHTEYYQYLTEYYNHHNCKHYIRFNTKVIHVKKNDDYDETGRFIVETEEKLSGNVSTDVFDGVIVATGHFNIPKYVTFPGQDKFKGNIIHTHSLKDVSNYRGKNVLVVGSASSALDAASNISSVAKNVYISTRSGFHVLGRLGPFGYPIDYLVLRRYIVKLLELFPRNIASRLLEKMFTDTKFDHRFLYVKPNYPMLSKDPIINDEIGFRIRAGDVSLKRNVNYFTENGVVFDGEETETCVDDVVLGTGYTCDFTFLEKELLQINHERIFLYKCVYPQHLLHSTLAFVGFVNPFGAGLPMIEIQTRWIAYIFSGKGTLPSQATMLDEIDKRCYENNRDRCPGTLYNSIRVDFFQYLEYIALEFGARPNIFKYFFTDLPLFLKLTFGPTLPYHYRLEGPHMWNGARNAIMTCDERLFYPLMNHRKPHRNIFYTLCGIIGNLLPSNAFK